MRELRSDPGASFDTEIELNADDTAPMVTWGTSPEQSVAIDEVIPDPNAFTDEIERSAALRGLAYQGLSAGRRMAGVPIQHVFIGSCTNGRISDKSAKDAQNGLSMSLTHHSITASHFMGRRLR